MHEALIVTADDENGPSPRCGQVDAYSIWYILAAVIFHICELLNRRELDLQTLFSYDSCCSPCLVLSFRTFPLASCKHDNAWPNQIFRAIPFKKGSMLALGLYAGMYYACGRTSQSMAEAVYICVRDIYDDTQSVWLAAASLDLRLHIL
jgi:hypothetical protein